MQVPVTLFDLLGIAVHRSEPVQEVFQNCCHLGLLERDGFDWVKTVSLKLNKPCPFLLGKRCSIYEFRPSCCILFPEHQAMVGTLETLAAQPHYRDYRCLHTPFTVPEQRAWAIRTLWRLMQQERLVSDCYLFDHSPFLIDFSNCVDELVGHARKMSHQPHDTPSAPGSAIPWTTFEWLFDRTFARCTPLAALEARLRVLAEPGKQEEIFWGRNTTGLSRRLVRNDSDRPVVHRYLNGELRATRQSLFPREKMFIW